MKRFKPNKIDVLSIMPMYFFLTIALFSFCQSDLMAVSMNWALVGDAGNTADTELMSDGTTDYGRVNYAYKIGTYEVTNNQYCEFLKAVAVTDTYGLYSTNMNTSTWGGIQRTGSQGSYQYTVKSGQGNKPVIYVSWHDALRFANWFHNGQPSGLQSSSTTENGTYTFGGATTVSNRNTGATFWLPSENEWYKAAYYKKGGTNAGYWNYATQSDVLPTLQAPPGGINSANAGGWPAGNTLYGAGSYVNSVSAYGTYDQCGNVGEWNETVFASNQWGLRGGAFDVNASVLAAACRERNNPIYPENWNFGFRIATIPEPATLILVGLGGLALRRRGKRYN